MGSRRAPKTAGGHQVFEVVSALQKSIRRGQMDDALYWATDLHYSGYDAWLWKRLLVITSEDVGPAWREGPTVIRSLFENWKDVHKKPNNAGPIYWGHAVFLLCRQGKTRVVDHALSVHLAAHDELHREIPDYALDMHTARGKGLSRGIDFFLAEAAKVYPEVDDPDVAHYRELERELYRRGKTYSPPPKQEADQESLDLEDE